MPTSEQLDEDHPPIHAPDKKKTERRALAAPPPRPAPRAPQVKLRVRPAPEELLRELVQAGPAGRARVFGSGFARKYGFR